MYAKKIVGTCLVTSFFLNADQITISSKNGSRSEISSSDTGTQQTISIVFKQTPITTINNHEETKVLEHTQKNDTAKNSSQESSTAQPVYAQQTSTNWRHYGGVLSIFIIPIVRIIADALSPK